jgi:rubrerythrin
MPASFVNDPEYWCDRAREKRTLAEHLRNEQAKQTMLRIARDYERLAERAEERIKRLATIEIGARGG